MRQGSRTTTFLVTAVLAIGLGWLGLGPLADRYAGEPVWWPLAGVGAMLLVFSARRFWPAIVAGLTVGSLILVLIAELNWVNVAGVVAGVCENVLVALLLRRLRPRTALKESLFDAVRVLGCVLAATLAASIVFALVGGMGGEHVVDLWSEYVRNHLLGLMLVAPCLAVSIGREELVAQLRDGRMNLEWLGQLTITVLLSVLVFLTHQRLIPSSALALPLIWGALRLGPLRAMITLLVSALMATIGTRHGLGRIAVLGRPDDELYSLQIAIGILALTTMVTAIAGRVRERALSLVQERTRDLNIAEQLAGLGSARWDPQSDVTVWSDGLHRLLGTDPAVLVPDATSYYGFVHPEDLDAVLTDRGALAEDGQLWTPEYRIVSTDGKVRNVIVRSMVERWSNGTVRRVRATIQDVTEARAAAAEVERAHQELASVLDAVTGASIMGTDREDGRLTFFNTGAEKMFGYRADEVIHKLTPFHLHDPVEVEKLAEAGIDLQQSMQEAISRTGTDIRQWTFIRKDGTTFPGQLSLSPQRRSDSSVFGYIGVITDLTGVLRAQEELAESQNRFRLAFAGAPVGMAMVSLDASDPGRILQVNDAFCDFTGQSEQRLLQLRISELLDDESDAFQSRQNIADLMSGALEVVTSERRVIRPDGREQWGRVSTSAVRPQDETRAPYLICLVEDITARKELTERLQHEAAHDSLTGLPNRLQLHRRLEHELRERRSGSVAVLYLDLDGFKAVNDSAGHGAGDELLVQVADRIAASVRSTDVVARLGGDEFAILCPGVPDEETAVRIAREVLAALSREFDLSQIRARVGASIGVAMAIQGDTGPDLLHAADQAMYSVKRDGKGSVRLNRR